jgi:tRNA1(Val) A37 N6-methylase TrmN6
MVFLYTPRTSIVPHILICIIFFKNKHNPDKVIVRISKEKKLEKLKTKRLQIYDENRHYTPKYLALIQEFLSFNF